MAVQCHVHTSKESASLLAEWRLPCIYSVMHAHSERSDAPAKSSSGGASAVQTSRTRLLYSSSTSVMKRRAWCRVCARAELSLREIGCSMMRHVGAAEVLLLLQCLGLMQLANIVAGYSTLPVLPRRQKVLSMVVLSESARQLPCKWGPYRAGCCC